MPTLSPETIRAVFAAGEDAPDLVCEYEPTIEDFKRAQERVNYASSVIDNATDTAFPTFLLALPLTLRNVGAMRDALRARVDRSTPAVRLARILLIDAARLLSGASEAVPV